MEQMVRLSGRLQTLADMVEPGSRVADVGCDHGFVPIYLVQHGISTKVIAADVRRGPLDLAGKHVREQGLEAYIETRLSDGLSEISAGEADTLICAGMGGRLMQRILKQGEEKAVSFRELILQPQSEIEAFRIFLRTEHYRIVREDILCEEGRYYFFMKAVPSGGAGRTASAGGAADGSLSEAGAVIPQYLADKYGGLLLRAGHPVLREYLEFMRAAYREASEQIRTRAGNAARAAGRLDEIRSEMSDIEEALKYYTQEGRE